MIAEEQAAELADRAGLDDQGRLTLEVIRRFDHPVLNAVFFARLRPYQLAWLLDFSRFRIALKGRRLGFTEVDALDTVFTASGFWEAIGAPVKPHNVNVISKREHESLDYIRRCKRWLSALAVDCSDEVGEAEDMDFRGFFEMSRDNDTFFRFKRSKWLVQSDTQSEGAGRGQEGHLKKDEAAHYKHARKIVAGADKVPLSSPDLRTSVFSTPQGTEGPGEVFHLKYSDTVQFGHYSRHCVDIHRAIVDGFPISVDEARQSCLSEEEFQEEFCCAFLGSAHSYFTRDMLAAATCTPPSSTPVQTVVGIDVASEVDLTALVVLKKYGHATWLEDVYLIRGVPYATDTVLGQEHIVAGLLWALNPDAAIIDASADGAVLYGKLAARVQSVPIVPHSFHSKGREWKATWVPLLREGFESGSLQIADVRPRYYMAGGHDVKSVTKENAEDFVDVAFRDHHFDALKHDLRQIRRKLLASGVTFESPRDAQGHGDSAWAALMGFSIVADQRPQKQKTDYKRLLDAALSGNSAPGIAGADYADFI